MPSAPSRFSAVAAALLCLATAGTARAGLLKVSPFLTPKGSASTPTANAPLEYRGSLEMGGTKEFRIVDPARKFGSWLRIGEKDANLDAVVTSYDPNHDTIVVDHGGQSLTLQLKAPKVVSAGMAPPPMLPPPTGMNVSPAVIQTVVPNPTPADEQRRLEAVAAEVARRRALREQAAQQAQAQAERGRPMAAPYPGVTRQELQQAQQRK